VSHLTTNQSGRSATPPPDTHGLKGSPMRRRKDSKDQSPTRTYIRERLNNTSGKPQRHLNLKDAMGYNLLVFYYTLNSFLALSYWIFYLAQMDG